MAAPSRPGIDSPYAWRLAFVSAFCIALGGGAIYLPVVALKEIAAEFGGRRESIPDELSILPDRYRAKTKSEKAKPEKQGAKQRDLKASPWGAERKPKAAHAKKSGAIKARKTGAKKPSSKRSK